MNALLFHVDGKLPNVALMRIASHHRALGHDVRYTARIEPFREAIQRWHRETGRPVAECGLAASRAAEKRGTDMDVLLAIAATVEECEAEGARSKQAREVRDYRPDGWQKAVIG